MVCASGGQRRSLRAFTTRSLVTAMEAELLHFRAESANAQRFLHFPIVSGRILSLTDAGNKTWRTRLPKVLKGMFPGLRTLSPREQFR